MTCLTVTRIQISFSLRRLLRYCTRHVHGTLNRFKPESIITAFPSWTDLTVPSIHARACGDCCDEFQVIPVAHLKAGACRHHNLLPEGSLHQHALSTSLLGLVTAAASLRISCLVIGAFLVSLLRCRSSPKLGQHKTAARNLSINTYRHENQHTLLKICLFGQRQLCF